MSLVLTCFGMVGLLLQESLPLPTGASLAIAAVAGRFLAVLLGWGVSRYVADTAVQIEREPVLMITGVVSVSIPAGGFGAIAYVSSDRRVTMPARGKNHDPLPQGTAVLVVDLDGKAAVVEELI